MSDGDGIRTSSSPPDLAHATLIYEPQTARPLAGLHREYRDVGQRYGLAMSAPTDTWRANPERLRRSKLHRHRVNQDNARFLFGLRESYGSGASPIFVGGQIGPRGTAGLLQDLFPCPVRNRKQTGLPPKGKPRTCPAWTSPAAQAAL
jgi:hypothetical protein